MIDALIAPFAEFAFMRRALIGCVALSLSAPPIGVFLMLRRMSLMGDVMAHAILPGAAVGFLVSGLSVGAMTIGGLAAGLAVALLAGAVTRDDLIKEDASLAAFYLISLAGGVLLISTNGSSLDLLHILFGTVLALDDETLLLLGAITTLTLVWLALAFRPLVFECVDPLYLRAVSRLSTLTHLSFLGIIVLNLVAGFQALGTLLAVGLMLLPAVTARFWAKDLTAMIVLAVAVSLVASVAGLLASYHASWPSGPSIVLVAGGLYLASMLLGPQGGLVARFRPARHLEA